MIEAGGRFVVRFTPPRAGTFIYHTHLHDHRQLSSGLYGAMIVVEPGETFDPATDHVLVLGRSGLTSGALAIPDGATPAVLNGLRAPRFVWTAGQRHRLRLINITADDLFDVSLHTAAGPAQWTPVAKDGAALPDDACARSRPARRSPSARPTTTRSTCRRAAATTGSRCALRPGSGSCRRTSSRNSAAMAGARRRPGRAGCSGRLPVRPVARPAAVPRGRLSCVSFDQPHVSTECRRAVRRAGRRGLPVRRRGVHPHPPAGRARRSQPRAHRRGRQRPVEGAGDARRREVHAGDDRPPCPGHRDDRAHRRRGPRARR